MAATLIEGKEIARQVRLELAEEARLLKEKHGVVPGLATVLVGEDPASQIYVSSKEKATKNLGLYSERYDLPVSTSQKELLELLSRLNANPKVNGILVQLPLPRHIVEMEIITAIHPGKDVDGFHPENLGKLMIGASPFLPCTPHGVQQLLIRSGIKTDGAEVVVVGRSNIVGKPIANILCQKQSGANATVTLCHTGTRHLADHTRRAEILIVAAGKARAITADMVREGAVVIDVGINRIGLTPEGKSIIVGDVDFDPVREKARAITPVPGGVGPMTITMLMHNTLKAARMAHGIKE